MHIWEKKKNKEFSDPHIHPGRWGGTKYQQIIKSKRKIIIKVKGAINEIESNTQKRGGAEKV